MCVCVFSRASGAVVAEESDEHDLLLERVAGLKEVLVDPFSLVK